MISYDEARKIIEDDFQKIKLDIEEIELGDALNRTLAEDIFADINLPPFNNSSVDGIAIRFDKSINEWKIIGEISAGNFSKINLDENSAVMIMTGAKIPDFCNTVIPLEDYELNNNNAVLKKNVSFKTGMNIRLKGSDVKEGELVLKNGTQLSPGNIAAAAACGKSKLKAFKKLKFAVLATGDELISVEGKPIGDKIRVSNTFGICTAVNEIYQSAVNLGIVNDGRNIFKDKITAALNSGIDVLITTGGVSVGKYDFIKEVFEELGVKEKFHKVNIKPGKPIYFGDYKKDGKRVLVFGMPGNPVSSLVCFYIFIKPAVEKLYQQKSAGNVFAVLQDELKKEDSKRHFPRGILFNEKGEWKVRTKFSQSSGNLVELSRANCLIVIREEKMNSVKGEAVECIPI